MKFWRGIVSGARAVSRREFWTFRVIHAVLGAVLTISGAAGALFVNDQIRKAAAALDSQIAETFRRTESIERALFQMQLIQTNGLMLGALSANEGLRQEYRASFLALSFVMRQGPTSRILQELNLHDVEGFRRGREHYLRLIEAAKPANDKAAWDAVLAFEMEQEQKLFELQQRFYDRRFVLQERKRWLDGWLDTATMIGFIVQQTGFVVILLAGLVHQHRQERRVRGERPSPAASALPTSG
jgi:hypothetical protein